MISPRRHAIPLLDAHIRLCNVITSQEDDNVIAAALFQPIIRAPTSRTNKRAFLPSGLHFLEEIKDKGHIYIYMFKGKYVLRQCYGNTGKNGESRANTNIQKYNCDIFPAISFILHRYLLQ